MLNEKLYHCVCQSLVLTFDCYEVPQRIATFLLTVMTCHRPENINIYIEEDMAPFSENNESRGKASLPPPLLSTDCVCLCYYYITPCNTPECLTLA